MTANQAYIIDVNSDCKLFYPLQRGYGDMAIKDFSLEDSSGTMTGFPAGHHFTFSGGYRWMRTVHKLLDGQGVWFNGIDGSGTRSSILNALSSFSIDFWFITDDVAQTNVRLVSQYVNDNTRVEIILNADNIKFVVGDGAANEMVTAANVITAGKLHHIHARWDKDTNSGKPSVFIDNVEEVAGAGITNNSSCNVALYIASRNASARFFKGVICSLSIYENFDLTDAQIEKLYNLDQRIIPYEENGATDPYHWNFKEQYGSTTEYNRYWDDFSGRYGRCLSFNGSDEQIVAATPSNLPTGDITLEAWVKINSETGTLGTIIDNQYAAVNGRWRLYYLNADNKIYWEIYNAANKQCVSAALSLDTWYHVVATYDQDGGADNMKLYIDAGTPTTQTGGSVTLYAAGNIEIGGDGTNWNDCCLQNVGIHAACRDATWIKDRYLGLMLAESPVIRKGADALPTLRFTLSNKAARYDGRLTIYKSRILAWMGDAAADMGFAFAGVVKDIDQLHAPPRMGVTAAGWASYLQDDYDATYGLSTGTHSTVEDVRNTVTGHFMPSYITFTSNKALALGVARASVFTQGTTKMDCIRQLMRDFIMPWRVDHWMDVATRPLHHWLGSVDRWCEATANWGSDVAVSQQVGVKLYGTWRIQTNAACTYLYFDILGREGIVCPMEEYDWFHWYIYDNTPAALDITIRLYTGAAYNAANYYDKAFSGAQAVWERILDRMPDETGGNRWGWTQHAAADTADGLNRIEIRPGAGSDIYYVDGLGFFKVDADPLATIQLTNQYLSGSHGITREGYASTIYAITAAAGSPHTVTGPDPLGDAEQVIADQNIANNQDAKNWAVTEMARRAVQEPQGVETLAFKPEYIHLERGDTIEITDAKRDLSAHKAIIYDIEHTLDRTRITWGGLRTAMLGLSRPAIPEMVAEAVEPFPKAAGVGTGIQPLPWQHPAAMAAMRATREGFFDWKTVSPGMEAVYAVGRTLAGAGGVTEQQRKFAEYIRNLKERTERDYY